MPAIKRKYAGSTSSRPLKRRSAVARTYSGATSSKVPLSMDHQLLRTKQDCVLRYHESFVLNPGTAGVPSHFTFRANSCFDPNFTGTGHQPRGYDQIMAMYQYLAVREVQIEVWFQPRDGAPVILSINADASAPSGYSRDSMMEQRTAVFKTAAGISSGNPGYISLRCKPWQLAGTKLSESDYRHLEGGNPIITQFLNVVGAPIEGTDTGNIDCVARLTYHCQVTEPKTTVSS